MLRLIELLEPLIVLGVLWVIINIAHAIVTSKDKTIKRGFFFLSHKIKSDLKGE